MTNQEHAIAGCRHIGDYIDEAECPVIPTSQRYEVVRPQVVANYCDIWESADSLREFTVLLKSGHVIFVRGHSLKSELPHADVFSIIVHSGDDEVVVALFKSDEVAGIFHGEMRPDRKIA